MLYITLASVLERSAFTFTAPILAWGEEHLSAELSTLLYFLGEALWVILLANALFLLWYVYFCIIGPLFLRFLPIAWITGPIPRSWGMNWRCQLSRLSVPYFSVRSRDVARRLRHYRTSNDLRGPVSQLFALPLTPLFFRLAALAFLIYGISLLQDDKGAAPSKAGVAWGSLAVGGCMLALHFLARRSARPNFRYSDIWGRRLLGILATVGALAAPAIAIFLAVVVVCAGDRDKCEANKGLFAVVAIGALIAASFTIDKLEVLGESNIDTARRMALPAADSLRQVDPRRPVLYLRPFRSDDSWVSLQDLNLNNLIMDRVLRIDGRQAGNFELSFIDYLMKYGPTVAIANQKSELPSGGAARLFATDEAWQRKVRSLLAEAELIFIMLGSDVGIAWELRQIFENGLTHKTVFLVPPAGADAADWSSLEHLLAERGLRMERLKKSDVRVFYLNSASDAVAFTSSKPTDLAYRLGVQFAIYGLKVHETDLAG